MALSNDNKLYAWGENRSNQLGFRRCTRKGIILVRRVESLRIKKVVCGGNQTFIITADDIIYAWGSNTNGQLGLGDTNNRKVPSQIKL